MCVFLCLFIYIYIYVFECIHGHYVEVMSKMPQLSPVQRAARVCYAVKTCTFRRNGTESPCNKRLEHVSYSVDNIIYLYIYSTPMSHKLKRLRCGYIIYVLHWIRCFQTHITETIVMRSTCGIFPLHINYRHELGSTLRRLHLAAI